MLMAYPKVIGQTVRVPKPGTKPERSATDIAIDTLVEICNDNGAPPNDRVAAADLILGHALKMEKN